MKNAIPEFLKNKLDDKRAIPKFFPQEMKEFIMDFGEHYQYPNSKQLSGDKLLSLWFRYMKNGISELGVCGYTGCSKPNMIVNDSKTNGFLLSSGCCTDHSIRISMLKKHGVENAMHLESSKIKMGETNFEKFGVQSPMQSRTVQDKLAETMLERYGVKNIFYDTKFIQEKFKEKYGVENPSQVAEFQRKKQETSLRKYGVLNPAQSPEILEKMQRTCLEKYGVKNMGAFSARGYRLKEYRWKTGQISRVQGYEDQVLTDLENSGYTFDDVKTGKGNIPVIKYFFENKQHDYYPDIFIPAENRIIEVKSPWTLNMNFEKNTAKFDSTIENGYICDIIVKHGTTVGGPTTTYHYTDKVFKELDK